MRSFEETDWENAEKQQITRQAKAAINFLDIRNNLFVRSISSCYTNIIIRQGIRINAKYEF